MEQQGKGLNWFLFIVLAFIWGSSFILMKFSKEHLNGYQIGAVRIFSAGLVFFPFALFHIFKLPRRKIPLILLSGLLGNLFPAFLFAIAIEKIDSSLEGILNSLTPLFVILIGVLFFKAKLARHKVMGVLVGFAGLVLLSLSSGFSSSNYGYALLILFATLLYGLNVNLVNYYLKGIDPLKMATVSLALVGIPAFFVVWKQEVFSMAIYDESARWSIAASVLLGIVGSAIATALFYILIKRAGGLFASLVTYAIPVVAIFWGVISGEQVTLTQIGCLAIILGGVYLVNKN
jgi:drug/metabolite transporter (DMT)-like permease